MLDFSFVFDLVSFYVVRSVVVILLALLFVYKCVYLLRFIWAHLTVVNAHARKKLVKSVSMMDKEGLRMENEVD